MYPTILAAAAAERSRDLRDSARRSHEAALARRARISRTRRAH
jgi:hypothetical protein